MEMEIGVKVGFSRFNLDSNVVGGNGRMQRFH